MTKADVVHSGRAHVLLDGRLTMDNTTESLGAVANKMISPTITPRSGVAERVLLTFRQSPHTPLRDLATADCGGTIVVSGRVPSFYMKQLAQVIAQKVEGVRTVENRTVVSR